jgi:Cu2+-exporting ATPase
LEAFSGCSQDEIRLASTDLGGGLRQTVLSVPDMRCAACIDVIEKTLARLGGVRSARANLTRRRVTVNWAEADGMPDFLAALRSVGYDAHPPSETIEDNDETQAHLVRALAVAGFCSMNIMLFSVSVWAGADEETRHAFQMFSAALAIPAVVYSGSSFYQSAWRALSGARLNMDVPISAGVLLSFALSLHDAVTNSAQAYFEAATSLLFVLLAGRLLDHMMRRRAKSAVTGLARLMPQGADLVAYDGSVDHVPLSDVAPGARLLVAAGARVPTDGVILKGQSELDASMLSGESRLRAVGAGEAVRAGEINRGSPFEFRADVAPDDSLLSQMARLLAAAEDGRTRHRRLADRAASLYAPVVHTLSLLAFLVWLHGSGDIHKALTIAISVLVITCPCALGLAVPMVQVALTRRLYDNGVLAVDGTAFERLAAVDTVVFDKTGTLTTGEPTLIDGGYTLDDLLAAGSLARHSSHPYSRALAVTLSRTNVDAVTFGRVEELPGRGLEGHTPIGVYRLGRPDWAGDVGGGDGTLALSLNGVTQATFAFSETLRTGAAALLRSLYERGIDIVMLSGDARHTVASISSKLGILNHQAELLPEGKVEAIRALQSAGHKVLMVGDGVNDAAALRTADVSMAPSTASDVGRSAADFVFLGDNLSAVGESLSAAREAMALVRQNFAIAAVYNLASLPLAFTGQVTPLAAALAMSTSSILVVLNSARLVLTNRANAVSVRRAAAGARA